MALRRGAVIEYPALFAFDAYPRPYLIVSNETHPFHGDEYIGLAVTTTALDAAVSLTEADWERGGLPKQSYVKPWQPTLLKHGDVSNAFGLVRSAVVDDVVDDLASILGR